MESPKTLLQKLQAVKESEAPPSKGRFRFEFSKSGLISLIVVGGLGLCWIFIFGVLVGRGYKPENAVPELAQIIPSAKPPEQAESQQPPAALKPEELQFMERLSSKAPPPVVEVDSTKKPAPGALNTASLPEAKKPPVVEQSLDAKNKDKSKSEPAVSAKDKAKPGPDKTAKDSAELKKDKKSEPEKANSKDKKLSQEDAARQEEKRLEKEKSAKGGPETVYQVASFPKAEMAKSYQDSLAAKGLRSSIEEATVDGGQVYRVLVHLKGGKGEVKAGLDKTGVKNPILRGKKNI